MGADEFFIRVIRGLFFDPWASAQSVASLFFCVIRGLIPCGY